VERRGWRKERSEERGGKWIDKREDKLIRWEWGRKAESEGIKWRCSVQLKRHPRRSWSPSTRASRCAIRRRFNKQRLRDSSKAQECAGISATRGSPETKDKTPRRQKEARRSTKANKRRIKDTERTENTTPPTPFPTTRRFAQPCSRRRHAVEEEGTSVYLARWWG
jgi:hypothetical protein